MFGRLVEGFAHPSIERFTALLGCLLPSGLLRWERSKGAGAQGDFTVFRESPCPRPRAPMSFGHQFHVSEVYVRNLIHAIRFHVDILDSVL